jgi:hypothetical protein
MKDQEIIDQLRAKLTSPTGRHLYAVLGSYGALERFAEKLPTTPAMGNSVFPAAASVTQGILDCISDEGFAHEGSQELAVPEVAARLVQNAFNDFLSEHILKHGLTVLRDWELAVAYDCDLHLLRERATDSRRVVLLLPGKRNGGNVMLFPQLPGGDLKLPGGILTDDHIWETEA